MTDYIKNAKPFIKWAGGKGKLISSLEKSLPKVLAMKKKFTYVEPFVGGGAVLFYILKTYSNIESVIINDINKDLITTYNIIKNNPNKLVSELLHIQTEYFNTKESNRKDFYLEKRTLYNSEILSDIEKSCIFIFLNKTCFNGLYRVNSKGLFNVPFGKYAKPLICDSETIYADSELLQKVTILNNDFEITKQYAGKNTFFYLDPPYRPLNSTSNFNTYTKDGFNDKDQIRLKHFCEDITKKDALFMLSNSDCFCHNNEDDFLDKLYSSFTIERILALRCINSNPNNRGKLSELLVRNYKDISSSNIYNNQLELSI